MSRRARALSLALVPVLLTVAAVTLQSLDGRSVLRDSEAFGGLAFLGFGLIGAVIIATDRRHPIGWLFYVSGVVAGATWATDEYAGYSIHRKLDLPGEVLAAWFQNWTWFLPIGLTFTFCLLLFPNGRPPTRRWGAVAWLSGASLIVLHTAFALNDEPLDGFKGLANPTGVLPDTIPLSGIAFVAVVVSAFLSVISLVIRYKRSKGEARQQIKLVVSAVVVMVTLNLGLPVFGDLLTEAGTDLVFGLSTLLFPMACGVAILRYRLYDVDLVINRALVYGSLSAILAFAYLGLVVVFQRLLDPITQQSDLAIAGSTLAVAALFGPLRARVQRFIDHRFYRQKYDATSTMGAFTASMRDQVDLASLTEEVMRVVGTTMQPAHASMWLRPTSTEASTR